LRTPPRGAAYHPAAMTKLQWIYVVVGLLVAVSMLLAVLPIGR
jgi:hypothetical protein